MTRYLLALGLLIAPGCGSAEPSTSESPPAATAATGTTSSAADDEPEGRPNDDPVDESQTETAVGQTAPDFTLTDQSGQEHHLADYRGKVVVLEWINPGCPYVQRHYQAETMTGLVERFAEREVVWLAIDSSHFVTAEDSQAWRARHELSYPILLDAPGDVGRLYGATTTPNMYVIDAEGVLRYRGAIDDDPRGREEAPRNYVGDAVQTLLEGGSPAVSETEPYGCTVKYENT